MEILNIIFVSVVMILMTGLYFVIGYRFLKKHRKKKDGDNKTL